MSETKIINEENITIVQRVNGILLHKERRMKEFICRFAYPTELLCRFDGQRRKKSLHSNLQQFFSFLSD